MSEPTKDKHYRFSIRHPVAMVMIFLSIVVFGWKSYQQLKINLMPNISYPSLTVRTEYAGAAPEDVEKLLTRPLEETLSIVGGVVEISSVSSASMSEITLEFTWDTEMNTAQQDVRDRLDLFDPPKEVTEKPVILRYDPTLDPVMRIALTGADTPREMSPEDQEAHYQRELTAIREAAERHVKSDLEAEIGIAQVSVKGGREEEIQILVDSERVKNIGISLSDINSSLAMQNINLSGGRLKEGRTEYLVRTFNEYHDLNEIKESIITNAQGRQVKLADVAEVFMGAKDRDTVVRINGREAVALDIYKDGDANTVDVCAKLKDAFGFPREKTFMELVMQEVAKAQKENAKPETVTDASALISKETSLAKTIRSRLPGGTKFTMISDQSRFIIAAIQEVKDSTIQGGFLAFCVLLLFLRDLRSTLVIGIAIPISLVAAFIPMFLQNISLNIMSLGGLALGVGMLVDNSIVVLESIFRCREEGDNPLDAAERGTHEVWAAVISATLTTVVVFIPIAFVEGIAGQLFGDLGMTVTFSLLASLAVSLYLNPMMVSGSSEKSESLGESVWMLKSYRESRQKLEVGRIASFFLIPALGLRDAWRWLCETARVSFAGQKNAWVAVRARTGIWSILQLLIALIMLPLALIMFVLQVVLKAWLAAFITVFFIATLYCAGIYLVFRKAAIIVFWLPLQAFDIGFQAFRDTYAALLQRAFTVGPILLLLAAGAAWHAWSLAGSLGQELIPSFKQGEFGIRMEAKPGTRLEETELLARRIEEILAATSEVDTFTVEVGREKDRVQAEHGENIARINVLLKNPRETSAIQDKIIARLRAQIATVTPDTITFTLPTFFSFKNAVELQIRGDDLEQLKEVSKRTLEAIRDVPGLKDPESSIKQGYPEIIIELDRDLLASRNIPPQQVAQRLRAEVQGEVATRFSRQGEKIDIRVRTDKDMLASVEALRNISVTNSTPPTPLSSVAHIAVREGPSEVRRVDQRQVVLITANVSGLDLGGVSRAIEERLRTVQKPPDYAFVLGGQNRELSTSYNSLIFALALSLFLVYAVMAAQFESFIHPTLIMATVPLALIGVVYALHWFALPVSVVVFIGGIILVGIVVDNAIVLLDYVNQLRDRGMTKREALVLAGQVRLRPIIMTTMTSVLGLLPMAFYTGEGAEMRRPLAITVMAGLSSATILTLIIIPLVYDLFGGRDKPKPTGNES